MTTMRGAWLRSYAASMWEAMQNDSDAEEFADDKAYLMATAAEFDDLYRRAQLGDAAMVLRDQEVALSGRLRERAEAAEQETWALREAASELLAALVVNATPKLGSVVDLAAVKLNELVKS